MPVRERTIYDEAGLRVLLQRPEGQFLDFKSLWDRRTTPPKVLERRQVRDLIAEHVAAFANADGGTLVLGVDDDGTPSGHGYREEAIRGFLEVVDARLRPALTVDVQRSRVDVHELLVFEVPMSVEAVMVEGNGFPYRVADRVLREPQEVINARKEAYRRVGFEQRLRTDATLADLDLELARATLRHTARGGEPVEALLEAYGLVVPRGRAPAITNAALLLFGRPPLARWHARMGVRFFRVAGTVREHGPRRNVTQLGRLELPIAALVPEAHRFASAQIRRSERLHDLFFRETPEYPTFAWQEAIVNAVAHRDYLDAGREVEVWFFDDRLEIESPGDPVAPVTLDRLRARQRVHASRNPLIVRVLAEAGVMREEGEGIPRMFEEMHASLLRDPELEVEAATFRVVLRNEPAFEGPSTAWKRAVDALGVSTSQKRALLLHPTGFTNEDYRKLNGLDRDQAYREIQDLLSRGVVTRQGKGGRGTSYVAVRPGAGDAGVDARLQALRDHFAVEPALSNAQFRALFEVTRHVATRELRRLVDEGKLVLEGARKATRYRPGPRL